MRIKQKLRRLGKAVEPAVYSGLATASRKAVELRAWTEKRIRDHMARHTQPEMVYLCVPGWDTEEEIRDAVRSARSIYESGKIPVCPYMMFPNTFMDSAQNRADSMKMRFRLLDTCQSVLDVGGGPPRHPAGQGDSDESGKRRRAKFPPPCPRRPGPALGILRDMCRSKL